MRDNNQKMAHNKFSSQTFCVNRSICNSIVDKTDSKD